MGPGVATRALRTGISIEQLSALSLGDQRIYMEELLHPFNINSLGINFSEFMQEFALEKSILQRLIKESKVHIVENNFTQKYFLEGKKILIE